MLCWRILRLLRNSIYRHYFMCSRPVYFRKTYSKKKTLEQIAFRELNYERKWFLIRFKLLCSFCFLRGWSSFNVFVMSFDTFSSYCIVGEKERLNLNRYPEYPTKNSQLAANTICHKAEGNKDGRIGRQVSSARIVLTDKDRNIVQENAEQLEWFTIEYTYMYIY